MKRMLRGIYRLLILQDLWTAQLACRAMKWRGFSPDPIHPKHLFDDRRTHFLQALLRPGMNVLDLGSGVGSDCIFAKRNGAAQVVGIEKSAESVRISRERAGQAGVDVSFFVHDIEAGGWPVPDGVFDIVYFSDVLEHLNRRHAVLTELGRKLAPGGRAIISVPNAETSWKRRLRSAGLDSRDDPDHKIEYSVPSLRAELAAAGLEIRSELFPIIPSLPINGPIALSAAVSPRLYRRFQAAKRRFVQKNPRESIGWTFWAR